MKISQALFLASAVLAASCGGQSATSPSALTTTPSVTDTFTGTLPPNGIITHIFNATAAGAVNITLTAAGPPDAIQVGLGAGTPNSDGVCVVEFYVTTPAGSTAQVSGTARNAGALCAAIFDVGNLAADINYSINVSHP